MNTLDKFDSAYKKHNCSLCGKEITHYAKVSIRATSPSSDIGRITYNSYRFILCDKHFDEFRAVLGKFIQDNAKKVAKPSSSVARVHTDTEDDELDKKIDELLS